MTDFLSEFNKNKEISEGWFDKLFGKKQQPQQQSSTTPPPPPQSTQQTVNTGGTGTVSQSGNTTNKYKPQKAPKLEFERGKIIPYDLTQIPVLGKFNNPITNISFHSPEDFQGFKAILYYLNHGYFDNDIKNIQRAIKYGEIDGYGPFVYLSSIFNKNKGTWAGIKEAKGGGNIFSGPKFTMPQGSKIPPKPNKGTFQKQGNSEGFSSVDSLRRMEKFVKYFVENLVDAQGNPNKVLRNSIISRLKKLFGTSETKPKVVTQTTPATTKTTTTTGPGVTKTDVANTDVDNGDENTGKGTAAKSTIMGALKEDIAKQVRDILRDNF